MKHRLKITIILLAMFVLTQFIGLYIVDHYSTTKVIEGVVVKNVTAPSLPYGLETPEPVEQTDFASFLISMIIAFIFAISLMLILTKIKAEFILKLWFYFVVVIALGISLNAFFSPLQYAGIMAFIFALVLAFFKIYKRNILVHNSTELIIYPGIAAVFVPILNFYTIIILLIIISIYDMWAVWKSGIMQKMAKYQMDTLKIFSGFFIPYVDAKTKAKIKAWKTKAKKDKKFKEKIKDKKIEMNVAILGGGDVIFPIITAGVMLKTPGFGLFGAISVIIGATLGLSYLFFIGSKKKFYPAMPYITAGIFLGILLSWIF